MNQSIKKYLSQIGHRGGKKSRRCLSSEAAKNMVKVREAKKLFKKYHTQCFWSYDVNYKVTLEDLPWICDQLMKNGDIKLWQIGVKLCR